MSPAYHAILGWDAGPRERAICGADVSFLRKTSSHVYVDCPACRQHPDFVAPRDEAAWPMPATVADYNHDMRVMNERGIPPYPAPPQ